MITEPGPPQTQATPQEKALIATVAKRTLPPVTPEEAREFRESIPARDFRKYAMEGPEFWERATALWKTTEPYRKSPARQRRLSLAVTAEAICLTTGRPAPWEAIHAVIMFLEEGFSDDRLVEYVQYAHRAMVNFNEKDHDEMIRASRLFSSRVFNRIMPLLRVGEPPEGKAAEELSKVMEWIRAGRGE